MVSPAGAQDTGFHQMRPTAAPPSWPTSAITAGRWILLNVLGTKPSLTDLEITTIYMKESQMLKPAETIIMGERRPSDMDDFWRDIDEVENGGLNNLIYCVQHARHGGHKPSPAGGSNYLYADGGVRYLRFGLGVYAVNEWISGNDQDRLQKAIASSVLINSPGLGHD